MTPLAQEKIATLAEFEPLCSFLFGPIEIDPEAWERVAGHERAAEILAAVQAALAACEWDVGGDRGDAARRLRAARRSSPASCSASIRVAVTGTSISPGLFESVHVLGRDETLARLAAAAAQALTPPATRWATTAASACAPAEKARPSRDASAPSAAPAASARAGADPGAGQRGERAQRELRGAAGGGVIRRQAAREIGARQAALCGPRRRRCRSRRRPRARPPIPLQRSDARHAGTFAAFRGGCGFCYLGRP